MRESREWTLDALADRAGLSKAYLSRLEGGDRQPSLSALCAVAGAFGVSIAQLFEHPDAAADVVIVRGGSTSPQSANGLVYRMLSSSTKPFNLQPIDVTIPADRPGHETYQHDGEEWVHVIEGQVCLLIDGDRHVLEAGDSAHFDSRLPHRLDAGRGRDARILLVSTPIPIALNPRRERIEISAASVG